MRHAHVHVANFARCICNTEWCFGGGPIVARDWMLAVYRCLAVFKLTRNINGAYSSYHFFFILMKCTLEKEERAGCSMIVLYYIK